MKNKLIHIILFIIKILNIYAPFLIEIIIWKIKFLLKYVLHYRSLVIFNNLKSSFGNHYSVEELKNIQHEYYNVLARYLKEIFYIISFDTHTLKSKIKLAEAEKWVPFLESQQSTVITASHYGNWEMNMVLLPALLRLRVIAFYKPISDKTIDNIMFKIRSAHGLELYPIEQTARIMAQNKNKNVMYIFIGDQSPLNMNGVYWNTFLQHDTPWLTGAEKLAKKFNFPVLYLKQIPEINQNVCYTLQFEMITKHPHLENPGSITEKYTRILEKEIIAQPIFWLWSHRRWKRSHLK